jgi:hypothetical protein
MIEEWFGKSPRSTVLAACFVLYYLGEVDVFWTIKKREP